MLFCGVDIGTTNVKAILLGEQGQLLAKSSVDARCNSSDWKDLYDNALDRLLSGMSSGGEEIYCSVAAQGGSFVHLNHKLQPISKQSLWLEKADQAAADELAGKFGKDDFYRITGWPPDPWLAICKLKRMNIATSDYIAFVPDYICAQLTGQLTTDITNAQISGLLDFQQGSWQSDLLDWANIGQENLAVVVDKIEIVHADIDTRWGKLHWVTSSHDQYAAMNALQIRVEKDIMLATGTAWVINQKTRRPVFHAGFGNHPGRDFAADVFGDIQSLGPVGRDYDNLLKHCRLTHTDLDAAKTQSIMQIIEPPTKTIKLCENISADGDFTCQAKRYMEAIAAKVRFQLETNDSLSKSNKIVMTGGAAASKTWPQIIADVCNITVQTINFEQLTAYGAACYAAQAAGVSFKKGLQHLAPSQVFESVKAKVYDQWYQEYQKPLLEK